MSLVLVPLLALMCQGGIHGKGINSLIGPYIAYTERFYMCEDNNTPLPWRWNLRVSHFNPLKPKELQRLTGNLTGATPFDDSCWSKVILDTWSNNQWKENAFRANFKNNACKALKEHIPGFYEKISRMEMKDACMLKPGVYEFNNTSVDWTFPKFAIMPYGHYRFRLLVGKAERRLACFVVECKIIPKSL
ncbi:uncharacterized protein LOC113210445 [Frankliniella occidentalis]|uniref:Uncharacterized protein LOC113210445 n=1 Tax=Frankliniella occidentalis TaxID=133901 RepID=A0A9C6UFI5_FRAOC|nr:uncharacterized protein LOC113210445 [Frankliniella occidentalis]